MTEFEENHSKQHNSGLNKSNLYSPHVSFKNMNKQVIIAANQLDHNTDDDEDSSSQQATSSINNDYHNLDEDIYDFSSVKRQMNMHENGLMNNYTDEEEDDINFDYEYGYDYERVIKDRLRKANQDFVNDAEPSKRKSIVVSFDNAVTAIDIPNETRPESTEEENKLAASQKKAAFQMTKTVHIDDDEPNSPENIAKKVPLNDTVQKEDPDAFANKIKQAVLRYDTELKNQMIENEKNSVGEINEYFREAFPDYSDEHQDNNESNKQESKEDDYKDQDFEDEYDDSKNQAKKDSKHSSLSSSPVFNKSVKNDLKSSTPSPPPTTTITQLKIIEQTTNEDNTKEETQSIYKNSQDWDKEEEISEENTLKVPLHNSKNIPSFSASSKMNEPSPSPISSFDTPEPINQNHVNNELISSMPLKNETIQNQTSVSSSLSSEKNANTNEFKTQDTKTSNEQMLVEKDGIFKLMSPEEYTAYEKQKQIERQAAKSASLFSVLPHPPTRPKTSYTTTGNRNSLKTRFLNSSNQQQQQPLPVRYSQSADPNGRRIELNKNNQISINNRRTPDYAHDYKSPYHVQVKSAKTTTETAEEKRRKEREEEERRLNNELAYKSWLKLKEEQRSREERNKMKSKNEENTCSTGNLEDGKNTYEYWLIRKREQLEAEKEFKKKLEQLSEQDRKTVTPEERSKAFKEWISRKLKEKNEAIKLEKLENKKWIARRRRSRKHQRLSQALELAQAYGYNSSFYSPGFNY